MTNEYDAVSANVRLAKHPDTQRNMNDAAFTTLMQDYLAIPLSEMPADEETSTPNEVAKPTVAKTPMNGGVTEPVKGFVAPTTESSKAFTTRANPWHEALDWTMFYM